MSLSSDLKLISAMASRLAIDLDDSPSGSIPVDSWFRFSDFLTEVAALESRLTELEVFFPEDFLLIGTDDGEKEGVESVEVTELSQEWLISYDFDAIGLDRHVFEAFNGAFARRYLRDLA